MSAVCRPMFSPLPLLSTVKSQHVERGFQQMPDLVDPTMMRALSVAGISLSAVIALCVLFLLTERGRIAYHHIEQALAEFAERRILACFVLFFSVIALACLPFLCFPCQRPESTMNLATCSWPTPSHMAG